MTDPDVERMIRLAELVNLARDGVITTSEAIARVRRDANLLTGADLPRMAAGGWTVAREMRNPGCLVTGLLHEWTVTHAAGDPIAVFATGEAFVRAATEVLIARDDGDLYRRAHRAADRMIEAAEPAWLPVAHYRAGQLRLAPYALDPANNQSEYALRRHQRLLRAAWSWPTAPLEEQLMPAPAGELGRAVRHLVAAAEGTTGRDRGAALAHLAFAEYSRHLADGNGSLSDVDRWCDESATLLPPQAGEPLAQGRLMWLYALRGKSGPFLERGISVPPLDTKPDGLVYNVLVGVTIVRLLVALFRADEAGEIVAAVWPLVADDPDLQVQRYFLDWAAAHSLPGDPVGCRARVLGAKLASSRERSPAGAAMAADRMHALLCEISVEDLEAEAAAIAAVRSYAPHLDRRLGVVLAYRRWMAARRALSRQVSESVPALIDAVNTLAHAGNRDLAMFALKTLEDVLHGTSADVFANIVKDRGLLSELVRMADNVLIGLPEAAGRVVVDCLSKLLAGWAQLGTIASDWDLVAVEKILATMQLLKGRALAGALTQPGPAPSDSGIVRALVLLTELDADPGDAPDDRPLRATTIGTDAEAVLNSYLHGAERERGSTVAQRRANVRRRAQAADTARLMASAGVAPRRHWLTEYVRALPDDAVLLNICVGGVGANASDGLQGVLVGRGVLRVVWLSDPDNRWQFQLVDGEEFGVRTRFFSEFGFGVAALRRVLVEDPLHRDVTRAGERELAMWAKCLSDGVLKPLAEFAATHDRPRLVFWPHESLYFLPLHLTPFRDGILADYFTVTILPSVECLFQAPVTAAAKPDVRVIACAAGGLVAGLPEEPSLHEQAERIADLFGTRPLIGADATPAAALEVLGTSRYLHLAAHGTQDVDAPLFARLYLAGGALHAYKILERDLRGTELVTLSACESALLRFDFLDNLHGLAPAFLRAGARAVIGALWPVSPEVAATFFTELYAYLAGGGPRVDAFRYAQNQARARHPNYRDWGAFTYFGA